MVSPGYRATDGSGFLALPADLRHRRTLFQLEIAADVRFRRQLGGGDAYVALSLLRLFKPRLRRDGLHALRRRHRQADARVRLHAVRDVDSDPAVPRMVATYLEFSAVSGDDGRSLSRLHRAYRPLSNRMGVAASVRLDSGFDCCREGVIGAKPEANGDSGRMKTSFKTQGSKGAVKVFDRKPVPKNSPLQDARRTASGHKTVKYDLAKMIESTFL